MATMVNMNSLLNGKDSRWLQLEVCREFQRNKCSRPDTECKFAHPPATVEVQNGRVTACYDSIKGRCNREKPPCKYFHPPQHLKDQLLINGRNHLALKNALMQQMGLTPGQVLPGQVPAVASSPYLSGVPGVGSTYAQYYGPQLVPAMLGHDPSAASPLGVMQQPVMQQKLPRTDRLETTAGAPQPAGSQAPESKKRPAPADQEPPPMDMKSVGSFYYDNFAFPGVMPYKRAAGDKAGVPVYQPATTYQQLMQLQQPFVPVSCEYPAPAPAAAAPPPPTPTPPAPAPPSPPAAPAPEPDAAARAKEAAHKSYAAALALAAQHSAMAAQAAHAYTQATQQAYKARAAAGVAHGMLRAPLVMRGAWPPPPYYQPPYMYMPPPPPSPAQAAQQAAQHQPHNPYKKMKTT
ncbi:muscleblind-like protein isoform X2 [Plutella xylostella]|uniref:muscleblind-like protein isoform X2 n=1 Tax=Plutella xylostella TaxID=51655 RepID=UPI0018D1275B|nr:muscleblind-like protein isoform X2 [Plutella xylostella]